MNPALPAPAPRPVTLPWYDGPDTVFSWEVVYPGGSAFGVTGTKHQAIQAVTQAMQEHDGRQGIVQKARLGVHREDDPDQYLYGPVVGQAQTVHGIVEWITLDCGTTEIEGANQNKTPR